MYFLKLTLETDLLWVIFPLALATIIMLIYFERYDREEPGWNTYVADSFVLLFISAVLIRHIYEIDGAGAINLINFPSKLITSLIVLILGILLLFLNFEHFLPEKIARYLNSPLTLNLFAREIKPVYIRSILATLVAAGKPIATSA